MVKDPLESTNLLESRREIADDLIKLAEAHKARFYPEQP
jgi:hypothetical protein